MTRLSFSITALLGLSLLVVLADSAFADTDLPGAPGVSDSQQEKRHNIRGRHGYQFNQNKDRLRYQGGRYFNDRDRAFADFYLADAYRNGPCPADLKSSSKGCKSHNPLKKWKIGQSLSHDISFYDVPPTLIEGIGQPPPGFRYIRIDSDILLINIDTRIVMDAMPDLGLR